MALRFPVVLDGGVLKEMVQADTMRFSTLQLDTRLRVEYTAGQESYISSADVSLGRSAESFLNIRRAALNQWHAHPNIILIDTANAVRLGDYLEFGNRTHIEIDDDEDGGSAAAFINVHCHVGEIRIGDALGVSNNTAIVVDDPNSNIHIGAALSNISLFGATPIAQPTTGHAAASFTANSGTAVNDASTFDGYTLKQVVKALRDLGLLA